MSLLDIIPRTADLGLVKVPDDRRTEDGLEKGLIGTLLPANSNSHKKSSYSSSLL